MPCQSYDSSWDRADDDRQKIKELKKQADMLARIACKALTELEKNEVEDMLLLRDDEVRAWWQKHKEDDAREQARVAELERKARIKEEALAKLSSEERELLGLAPKPVPRVRKKTSSGSTIIDIESLLKKVNEWDGPFNGDEA
jgi:predicted transposase YdaD